MNSVVGRSERPRCQEGLACVLPLLFVTGSTTSWALRCSQEGFFYAFPQRLVDID